MQTWEVFQCCSWKLLAVLCLLVPLCSGGSAGNPHRLHITLLQCVLVHGCAVCLCWEWTQEKLKVWIFWDSLAGGRFKTSNLLQSVMPGSYQHCCDHSNTFFFTSCRLTNKKLAGDSLSVTMPVHLSFIMDSTFPEVGTRVIFCPFKYHLWAGWLDASLRKNNPVKQAMIPLHY